MFGFTDETYLDLRFLLDVASYWLQCKCAVTRPFPRVTMCMYMVLCDCADGTVGCTVVGRGVEPPQCWWLLLWLEPGPSHVTWVHYDASMCLACLICSVLPVLHFL